MQLLPLNTEKIRKFLFTPTIFITIVILLISIFIYLLYFRNTKNSFLNYADQELYKPLNENGLGLIGKINRYLDSALTDTSLDANVDVFDKYKRLTITVPVDESDASFKDTRLVGFTPKTKEESDFYYNSQFHELVEKQQKDLSEQYFKIVYSDDKKRIQKITVDSLKLFTSIGNTAWKGTINFKDPTKDWDSDRKFIVCENTVIPLFTDHDESAGYKQIQLSNVDENELLKPQNVLNAYWSYSHKLQISIPRKLYFRIYQTSDSIIVTTNDTATKIILNNKPFDTIAFSKDLKTKDLIFNLQKNGNIVSVIITSKSPYELASQVANGAYAGNRININNDYSDLFSSQIINSLVLQLKDSDINKSYSLSYDAVQAKYYEDIFKNDLIPNIQNQFGVDSNTSYEISLTLVDIANGEIITAPFYSSTFLNKSPKQLLATTNFNLRSSYYEVGSVFKPILACASVLNYPVLLKYKFRENHEFVPIDVDKKIYNVNGFNIKWKDMKTPTSVLNFSNCDTLNRFSALSHFLAVSHDCYPIGMVMNTFVDASDNDAFSELTHHNIPDNLENVIRSDSKVFYYDSSGKKLYIKNIQSSNLCKILQYVFGLPVVIQKDDNNYFPGINYIHPYQLLPEPSSLFSMDADQINEKQEFSFEGDLRTWMWGQGELDLSLYNLSQAYARLISKKDISLNYMMHTSVNSSFFTDADLKDLLDLDADNGDSKTNAWDNFLAAWEDAQNYPRPTFQQSKDDFETARAYFPANLQGDALTVLFKTGTPANTVNALSILKEDTSKNVKKDIIQIGKHDAGFIMCIKNSLHPRGIVMAVHFSRRKLIHNKTEGNNFIMTEQKFQGSDLMQKFLTQDVIKNIVRFNEKRF